MERRNFLSLAALSGVSIATLNTPVSAAIISSNFITVGNGGDYATLENAINSILPITSELTPSVIKLLPGKHYVSGGKLTIPQWTAIEGCGQEISTIELVNQSTYLSVLSNSRISNLSIKAHRSSASSADGMIVAKEQKVTDFYLNNVSLYLTGGYKSAILQKWYTHVWYWDNINIFTNSVGAELKGTNYIKNINVFLSGDATGTNYIGFYIPQYARLYIWGAKVGTGYGSTTHSGFGKNLEIINDGLSNVVGFFIPAANISNPRIELHNLESFCRNDQVSSPDINVNCVRAENGIVRMFGCFTQSETPLNNSIGNDLYINPEATIEFYAGRFTRVEGNLSSRNQQAIAYKDTSNDGGVLGVDINTQHGSVVMCDATEGNFVLKLANDWIGGQPSGMLWTFIKKDESYNTITIQAPNNGLISGSSEVILSQPYDRVKIIHDDSGSNLWYLI